MCFIYRKICSNTLILITNHISVMTLVFYEPRCDRQIVNKLLTICYVWIYYVKVTHGIDQQLCLNSEIHEKESREIGGVPGDCVD